MEYLMSPTIEMRLGRASDKKLSASWELIQTLSGSLSLSLISYCCFVVFG